MSNVRPFGHRPMRPSEVPMPSAVEQRWYTDQAWEMYQYLSLAKRGESVIYIVGLADNCDSPLKIGTSKTPTTRVASMQVGNFHPLLIERVIHGDRGLEQTLHAKWREARVTGEWFSPCVRPEVLAVVDNVARLQREGRWLQSRFDSALVVC